MPASFEWTAQQEQAIREIRTWMQYPDRPFYYLAGWAGTGKTTLVKELTGELDGVLYAAFTGKAASVLQRYSGLPAQTLHSLLYLVSDPNLEKLIELNVKLGMLTPGTPDYIETEAELNIEVERSKRPRFRLNPESPLRGAKLLVLDECSMVNERLGQDALSFGVPILVLGDPAQLRPVKGGGYFTDRRPDFMLTDIRRQALDNPIIRWSKIVREGGMLDYGEDGPARKVRKGVGAIDAVSIMLEEEDVQLLTGKNLTRRRLNHKARCRLGRASVYPEHGDRLVCLRNARDLGFLNGVLCECVKNSDASRDDATRMMIRYEGRLVPEVETNPAVWEMYPPREDAAEPDTNDRSTIPFDYGYCLTVHKSQGSQWRHVVICDDGFAKRNPAERREWLYTAITRATEKLTVIA